MQPTMHEGVPSRVLIRDFLIFQLKTSLDGLKDAIVIPLATIVVVLDLVFLNREKRGRTFYSLMGLCESFDRWLNLHGALLQSSGSREGLFAGSEPGDGTMVGDLEELMRRGDSPASPAGNARGA